MSLRKGPRPRTRIGKKKLVNIPLLNKKWDKPFYQVDDFLGLTAMWEFVKDFKWIIFGSLAALLILAFLPGKIWVLGLFTIISYITNVIDGLMRLPFKVETGVPIAIILAGSNASPLLVFIFVALGMALPHIQTAYFFRPASMMLYLWLLILLKIVYLMPFGMFFNSLIGIILFNFGFLGIAYINSIALPFSRSVWSVFKNIIVLIIIYNLGVLTVF